MLGVQNLGPTMSRRVAEEVAVTPVRADMPDWVCDRGPDTGTAGAAAGRAPLPVPGGGAPARRARAADLERDAWVVLLSVPGLGPVTFGALMAAFGSARAVLTAATDPSGPDLLLAALADGAATAAATVAAEGIPVATLFDGSAADEARSAGSTERGAGAASRRSRSFVGHDLAARICEAALQADRTVQRVRSLGLTVVTLEEDAYPDRLRLVELPPPLLYVRGDTEALSASASVAVVGTRWPTDRGRAIAGWIGSAVARMGAVVVSGLAVGIDGAAHAAVVAEGGRTVAVLGGGHARLFPRAHERLAQTIVDAGGAIVSELAPETSPSRGTFPRRNRLVSGLSDATVVVEAGRRSGALITAGWALEQGRECFLVPGPLDSAASAGCHAFLRSFQGQARIVAGIPELLEDLELADRASQSALANGAARAPSSAAAAAGRAAILASLGPVERVLAEELGRGPATADQLALKTSLAGAAVLSALTLLELRGLATGAYGRYSPAGPLAGWSGTG